MKHHLCLSDAQPGRHQWEGDGDRDALAHTVAVGRPGLDYFLYLLAPLSLSLFPPSSASASSQLGSFRLRLNSPEQQITF